MAIMTSIAPPELAEGDIHIWTFPASAPDALIGSFARILDNEETDRAARFRFRHLVKSFVTAHGVLRNVLGRYLHLDPAKIRFTLGGMGKPMLAPDTQMWFNMTHSGDLTVIALAVDCEIGVDVEKIRPISEMRQIADRHFCAEEVSELMSIPDSEREYAFFCCWTRKEAYLKAIGAGLAAPLNDFRVSVHPEAPSRFVHIGNDFAAADAWTLNDLSLAPGYAAALAYQAPQHSLSYFSIADFQDVIGL